jgi:protein SCO1/2
VILDSRGQRFLLLVLLILLGAIAAVLVSSRQSQGGASTSTRSEFQGPTLPAGLRAANFTLIDQDGHGVSLASYRGRAVVLTFIHSQCHDQCPFMVEQIKGALNNLPAGGSNVPVLGISVAPAEDTPSSRRRFLGLHEMQHRISFLNGPLQSMRQVWHAYAIAPQRGQVNHSAFVLLIDRRGFERVGFAADDLTPEGLAHDLLLLERERA